MATYFEKQFKEIDGVLFVPGNEIKKLPRDKSIGKEYMIKPMTLQEKKLLAANIKVLNRDQIEKIKLIAGIDKSAKAKLNLAKLSPTTLRELEKFVKLTHQVFLHGNRQRNISNLKRQFQSDYCYALPEKRSRSHYNEEMEYY